MVVETNKYTMLWMRELYKLEGQDRVSVMRLEHKSDYLQTW